MVMWIDIFVHKNANPRSNTYTIYSSYTIDFVERIWGYMDESGNWTGTVRRIMDGMSTN